MAGSYSDPGLTFCGVAELFPVVLAFYIHVSNA